jgi:arylsulfatase A-like enzyme
MPTILEAVKLTPKKNLDAKTLFPFINGKENKDRPAFSETGGLGGPYPSPKIPNIHSLRYEGWKLIHNSSFNTFELYDLTKDPKEENNLFGRVHSKEKELFNLMKLEINAKGGFI